MGYNRLIMCRGLSNIELIQKIDGQRAPLHMFEVAQLANLIPQVSIFKLILCLLPFPSLLRP